MRKQFTVRVALILSLCAGMLAPSPADAQGNATAQFSVGVMYDKGQGVPKDDGLAYMWFNLAAASGYETARENRDLLSKKMTSKQIAEAQRMAREWLEKRKGK